MKFTTPREYINRTITENLPAAAEGGKAAVRFLSILRRPNVFLLDEDTIATLRKKADEGDIHALYAIGLYHRYVIPEKDSLMKAEDIFKEAYAKGIADAGVRLADIYSEGTNDRVDYDLVERLIQEAYEKGSALAEMDKVLRMDNEKALSRLDELIERDGEDNLNWQKEKAFILMKTKGLSAGAGIILELAEKGVRHAWKDYVLTITHNDDLTFISDEMYYKYIGMLKERPDMEDSALMAIVAMDMKCNNDIEDDEYVSLMEDAFRLGSDSAACHLGDYYMEKKDNQTAWTWWEKGGARSEINCIERMLKSAISGTTGKSEEEIDHLALRGVRLGSEYSLYRVGEAFKKGRLAKYKKEIAAYHMKDYREIMKWDECRVTGYITACDPGRNTTSCDKRTYRRDELKIGMNLTSFDRDLPSVTVAEIGEDYLVVRMGSTRHKVTKRKRADSDKKGLSYAYSEVTVSLS